MATKTEYLAVLLAKSFIQEVGTPVLISEDTELKVKIYKVQLLEKNGTVKAIPITHKFAVYKEGLAQETAFDLDGFYVPYFQENAAVYAALIAYAAAITNLTGYQVKEYNRDGAWIKVLAWMYVTDHIEEKYYFIYNDGGLTHKEITITV